MGRPLMTNVPETVKEALETAGYHDLCDLSRHLGVSAETVYGFFRRGTFQPLRIYSGIAEALGLSLHELSNILEAPEHIRTKRIQSHMLHVGITSQNQFAR